MQRATTTCWSRARAGFALGGDHGPPEAWIVDRFACPHGAVVVVELPDAELEVALARLPSAERTYAATLSAVRRRELIAGRTALRATLTSLDRVVASTPILHDDRGAPILPAGWVGSISHKGTRAVALVASVGSARVGVDIERAGPPRQDIARRILTLRELAGLEDRGPAVTLRFSIKEAIYKAIDPFLRRYVGFTEVEVELVDDGVARVRSALPVEIEATWRRHGEFWLATARAIRR